MILNTAQIVSLYGRPAQYSPRLDAYVNDAGQQVSATEFMKYNSYYLPKHQYESLYDTFMAQRAAASAEAKDKVTIKVNKPEGKLMDAFKSYLSKNSGVIFTVAFVVLIDHFVFNGTFRDKIKSLVDGFLNKAAKQVESA